MYLLGKSGDHRSYIEMEISILIEKAELTASITRFLKSGIPIYNFEVPDTSGKKTRRRRTQTIAERFAFHATRKDGSRQLQSIMFFKQTQ